MPIEKEWSHQQYKKGFKQHSTIIQKLFHINVKISRDDPNTFY